ncbi:hypothetical protein ACF1G3_37440 [Streptomyces rochei]|uniref:hypothetical protein n=1 Tax=Streptomyces rochei TaxID=1928 RepID=UPI003700208B
MTAQQLARARGRYRQEGIVGSGAGVIIWAVFFFYVLVMAPFCILIGAKTSSRMGWLMAAPLIFLPLALLIAALIP